LKVKSDGSKVVWGTWLCGSGRDHAAAMIAVDPRKRVYFAQYTSSRDLPTAGKGRKTYGGGENDIYLACLSPDGSELIYGTYLGGSGDEMFDTHELAVDAQGNAYVAAWTSSTDCPVTPGVFQPNPGGDKADQAVCKIGPDGELLACSYLGGRGADNIEGIAVDAAGNVYVTGTTRSPDLPVSGAPLQSAYAPGGGVLDGNGFVAVIAADFTHLTYASFVGGKSSVVGKNGYGGFHASALAPDGSWVAAGSWHGAGFPTRNAYHADYSGGPTNPPYAASDAVIMRLVPISK
jgi:hypothetical protein